MSPTPRSPAWKQKESDKNRKTELLGLSLNARSIMNKVDLLQATAYNVKPDIIGVTESWTHSAISDSKLYLEGYQLFRYDQKSSSKGGGVLLYVNSELNPVEFFTKTPWRACVVSDRQSTYWSVL